MNLPLRERATACHRAGDLAEARRLYGDALTADPTDSLARFRFGLLELQDHRPLEALAFISRAAHEAPQELRYQLGLAQALQTLTRWVDAEAVYEGVLQRDSASADGHFGLGVVLQAQARHERAASAFQRAVTLREDFLEAHLNLGVSLHRLGRLAEAAAAWSRALALRPDDARCLGNRGAALRELGDAAQAAVLLRRALEIEPWAVSHAINLALALGDGRDFAGAETVLRGALEREPENADVTFNLGNALRGLGRLNDAVDCYRRTLAVRPDDTAAWNNLANALNDLGAFPAALEAFEAALAVEPDDVTALNNLGCLLRTLGRSDAAEAALRRGLAIDGEHAALHDNLGNVLKDAGDLPEAIRCFRRSLEIDPANAVAHSNLAYALSFHATEARPLLEECRRWNQRFALPLSPGSSPIPAHGAAQRLKVGYVSADFREHCQSLFTLPLLSHHDHSRLEVYCYSSVRRPDETTRRLAGHADVWRDVRGSSDAELAQRIRGDGIDILVDLTMHMASHRLLTFARRPAPVQIAWLAYPGTTGMDAMDFRLSDERLDPPGADADYSERTLRLADSFWCYDPLSDGPAIRPLPALERGYLTLGCLNNPCKLSEHTLALWGAVMRALPQARLTLLAPTGHARLRLIARLDAVGIAAGRVRFVGFQPRAAYLREYHGIDLGLDSFPYNGHTTSLDASWMGVPTVSRVGETSVGRGGLSQLYHLGLLELATRSDEEFVERAVAWGSDLPRLATLRRSLRGRLQLSALMDGARFARSVEAAYATAWSMYRKGAQPPA